MCVETDEMRSRYAANSLSAMACPSVANRHVCIHVGESVEHARMARRILSGVRCAFH